jgi:uncharacterized UBP type Zn finger protein
LVTPPYCTSLEHARKKNCAKNPWCVYGLGEREGIWKSNYQVLGALGVDPSIYLRTVDPKDTAHRRLLPPAGLKNLGATCYLNVLIQVDANMLFSRIPTLHEV